MDEERIALFIDSGNLAIGAREALGGMGFDFDPIANALAERGRVVSRRAYADWSMLVDARQPMTRSHVVIEIPQRMGATRKNAADIKLAVDAIELAFERDYVTTFVICTGDSDFTPLVWSSTGEDYTVKFATPFPPLMVVALALVVFGYVWRWRVVWRSSHPES